MKSRAGANGDIQLQQKLIHYKSEAAKYKQLLEESEKQLIFTKEKYQSLMKEKQVTEIVEIEKEMVEIVPFFSYSLMVPKPDTKETNIQIIGNFVIKNTGNVPITTPIICIRIKSKENIRLGGKISDYDRTNDEVIEETVERWTYVKGQKTAIQKGEHWLKPTHLTQLEPGEFLSFSQFDIAIPYSDTNQSAIIVGYAYFNEIKEGIPSINPIIVNVG